VLQGLQAVSSLRKGRSDAPEPEAVKPVSMERVEAVEPYVSRQVWAMIQLQLHTAARAGELTRMRPCDIDMGEACHGVARGEARERSRVWVYRPREHKTAHHGHERKIFIGPRGQQVLAPFLLRDPDAYCFSPAEALLPDLVAEPRSRALAHTVGRCSMAGSPGQFARRVEGRWERSAPVDRAHCPVAG